MQEASGILPLIAEAAGSCSLSRRNHSTRSFARQRAPRQMAARWKATTAIAAIAVLSLLLHRSPQPISSFAILPFNWALAASTTPAVNFPHAMDRLFTMLGFGSRAPPSYNPADVAIAQGPDADTPATGREFACFGAGCFWGVELAYQRVPGVTNTEVGYSQGQLHLPTYEAVCSGNTGHSEVVRVEYNPAEVSYANLLDVFWNRHDPTTLNRQGGDSGTQYRSGIYFYSPEQERGAKESLENHQKSLNRKIVTEVLPAKKFYRAESYHQQYLGKGGRMGLRQSTTKGCTDPIRCYG